MSAGANLQRTAAEDGVLTMETREDDLLTMQSTRRFGSVSVSQATTRRAAKSAATNERCRQGCCRTAPVGSTAIPVGSEAALDDRGRQTTLGWNVKWIAGSEGRLGWPDEGEMCDSGGGAEQMSERRYQVWYRW